MKKLDKKIILDTLHKNKEKIKKFGVKKILLFGSYARDEQKETSDIDFLVEFYPKRGLFDDKVGLLILFEELFEKEIDLIKPELIRKELKEEILGGILYAAEI